MRYIQQKAFPYPILASEKDYSDDFPNVGFQAYIKLEPDEGNNCSVLSARVDLKEEVILKHIKDGKATYGVHVFCTKTNYRRLIRSSSNVIQHSFAPNELYGSVVLMACVVCVEPVSEYQSDNFHKELSGHKYNMPTGGVLAIAPPKTYHVDPQLSSPLETVFIIEKDKSSKDTFQYDIDGQKIIIKIPEANYASFNELRRVSSMRPFVDTSVYYPVLVEVLRAMATEGRVHSDKKWYRAIEYRLNLLGINLDADERIYIHAQQLMEYPLTKLRLVEGE